MAYTFHTIIQHIREDAYTEKDKGGRFEKIIKNYFRTSRNYASQVKDIWLWGEFPYRSQFGGKIQGSTSSSAPSSGTTGPCSVSAMPKGLCSTRKPSIPSSRPQGAPL